MHNIPVTVLDNFFDDPDAVRELAIQQKFEVDSLARWPGKRTKPIHEISTELHTMLCARLFSLFYDFRVDNLSWAVDATFQKVDASYKEGWIHSDAKDSVLSAIIYLTPNADINSGTSIYRRKKENKFANTKNNDKKMAYLAGEINNVDIEKYRLENNSQFEETIKVGNVYNRLIAFDSQLFHAAQSFFGNEEEDNERLTLVLFTNSLIAGRSPVFRSKRCL